ncbi:MAG: nitroreductase family protein [Candidatus Marinimicrobia bacterium]|nr:nitroreductase family protein [Candidatus Neomarinimicrobiota bacterium]MBL7023328.1 nitroreductase family protein [Candidatus Neomarinimicrobiota bacterium]
MINSEHKNETLESIFTRHSIRNYDDKPVDKDLIHTILQAANQAPSAHNSQSWRFIIIKGEKKKDLVDLINKTAGDLPRTSSALLRMSSRSISSASIVIAVTNTGELVNNGQKMFKISQEKAHDFFRTMEIQNSSAAVENLMIAANSLGLGTVWLGILFLIKKEILDFLGEPDGEFMAVIPVGYPKREAKSPKKRDLDIIAKELK